MVIRYGRRSKGIRSKVREREGVGQSGVDEVNTGSTE